MVMAGLGTPGCRLKHATSGLRVYNAFTTFMTTLSSSSFIEQQRICCGYFIHGSLFIFPLFLGIVMYDIEFGTKEDKN